jgi:hypothetical protein
MFAFFITCVAWPTAVLSVALTIGRIWAAAHYTELEEALDSMRGVKVHFPIKWPGTLAIISCAWLVAYYFG